MRRILLSLIFLFALPFVIGFPQIPIGYYGIITDSDDSVLTSGTVQVKSGNILLTSGNIESNGYYSINIPWEDPDTSEDDGVEQGEEIKFFVDGNLVKTISVGVQGTDNELNLKIEDDDDSGNQGSSSGSSSSSSSDNNQVNDADIITDSDSKDVQDDDDSDTQIPEEFIIGAEDVEDSIETNKENLNGLNLNNDDQIDSGNIENSNEDSNISESDNKKTSPIKLLLIVIGIIGIIVLIYYYFKRKAN